MEDNRFYTVRGYQIHEQSKNVLSASLEDYLEMIYREMAKEGYVRVNTLASMLNVSPSSASKMIAKLNELGFIDYEKYGVIRLTEKGNHLGRYLLWRHDTVCNFFELILRKKDQNAFIEAELVEHILNKDTVENIEKLTEFILNDKDLASRLNEYLEEN